MEAQKKDVIIIDFFFYCKKYTKPFLCHIEHLITGTPPHTHTHLHKHAYRPFFVLTWDTMYDTSDRHSNLTSLYSFEGEPSSPPANQHHRIPISSSRHVPKQHCCIIFMLYHSRLHALPIAWRWIQFTYCEEMNRFFTRFSVINSHSHIPMLIIQNS